MLFFVHNHYYSHNTLKNVASVLADGYFPECLSIRNDYHQGNIDCNGFYYEMTTSSSLNQGV